MEILLSMDLFLFACSHFTESLCQALGLPGKEGESPAILQLMENVKALGNQGKTIFVHKMARSSYISALLGKNIIKICSY